MSATRVAQVRAYLMGLQQSITDAVAALDDQAFVSDTWEKAPGELQGNGITRFWKVAGV
jgi:coproporphyrinogen III oxidase